MHYVFVRMQNVVCRCFAEISMNFPEEHVALMGAYFIVFLYCSLILYISINEVWPVFCALMLDSNSNM